MAMLPVIEFKERCSRSPYILNRLRPFLKFTYATLSLIGYATAMVYSQGEIAGTITSVDGHALSGALIQVVGRNAFAVADSAGRFTLPANTGDLLEVSFLGYKPVQLTLSGEKSLNILMSELPLVLDEMVVIGYGTASRKNVTGAVATISRDDFVSGNVTNGLQQVQGKIAGVVITQPGGDPNGDFTVRIRGATSIGGQPPLLVIDGVAIDDFNRAITTLNPNDIASFDVLKDASAASIYGSRGANGVILITTKKAHPGKIMVEYNGFGSVEEPSSQFGVLTGDQWRGAVASDTTSYHYDKGVNTDWQKEITRVAYTQSHSISVAGGNEQLRMMGSLGYINQEGVVLNTGKEVLTARINADVTSENKRFMMTYCLNGSVINRNFLPDQTSTAQVTQGGAFVFSYAPTFLPVWPVYNSDSSYFQPPNAAPNPVFLLNELHSKQVQNFFQGSVKGDYEILDGLRIGGLAALSKGNDQYDQYWPPLGDSKIARAFKSSAFKTVLTGDLHFNFEKNIGNHSLGLTGVYEYNKFGNEGFAVGARGPDIEGMLLNNNLRGATSVTPNDLSSFKNEVRIISFLGRLVYDYRDRYFLTANFRRDGSSKFGANNRWGNFPSASVAWRVSNETFMQGIDWLDLKLRMSYGLTGNQENLEPYSYKTLYSPSGNYLLNGNVGTSFGVTQEGNPDLKWEVRKSFNVGMDFSLWHDRINGMVDFFRDNTSDMLYLYNIPQPPFITNQVYANAADATNKGMEITLSADIIRQTNFSWRTQVMIASVRNRITNLASTFRGYDLAISNANYGYALGGSFQAAYVTQLVEGYPAGVFWLPEHAGLDKDGRELFVARDNMGQAIGLSTTFADKDRIFVDPTPDFEWSFTNNFAYKNFYVSIYFRGVQGGKIFANSILSLESTAYLPGRNVTEQSLHGGFTNKPDISTYWLQDASFVRLENVTFGYDLKNLRILSKLYVYVTGRNLFVLTNYKGLDPEVDVEGTQRYIDQSYYPRTRSITFGLDINL